MTFGVEPGEIFGFLGPNGAGKTTTINMLCTLLQPDRRLGDASTASTWSASESEVRRSIGLVFQQTTLDEYLSAEQNLRFHAYAYGIPAERPRAADDRAAGRSSTSPTGGRAACGPSPAA